MIQFKTAAFGGYKKEEVNSVVNNLEDQIEQLKSSATKNHENARNYEQESKNRNLRIAELEASLAELEGSLTEINEQLEAAKKEADDREIKANEEIAALKNSSQKQLEEMKAAYEAKISGMEAQCRDRMSDQQKQHTEERYAAADRILFLAEQNAKETKQKASKEAEQIIEDANSRAAKTRLQAEAEAEKVRNEAKASARKILLQARADADQITGDAMEQVQNLKSQAETAYTQRSSAMNEKYQQTRAGIREYMNSLNTSEEKLLEIHRNIVSLIQQMPLCIDDFVKVKEETTGQKQAVTRQETDTVVPFEQLTGEISP